MTELAMISQFLGVSILKLLGTILCIPVGMYLSYAIYKFFD